jgi:hypothetical protein
MYHRLVFGIKAGDAARFLLLAVRLREPTLERRHQMTPPASQCGTCECALVSESKDFG